MIKERFFEEDLNRLQVYSNSSEIKISELSEFIECLSIRCDTTILDMIGDFSLPEEKLFIFTGLTWENIIELREMMTSMRDTQTRTVTQALVIFLLKLRTGNSNKLCSAMLQFDQEQLVSEYSGAVMKSFEKDVLPTRFGIKALSRVDLISYHTSDMAKKLYDCTDKLMIICDGTYARHQKSKNNEYQRKSYSGQKKVPLCKPFTVCTTTGRVLDMLGPYHATENDASIMENVISDPNGLSSLMKPGDIFFVDRGFRDVKNFLESEGYNVLMPALKEKISLARNCNLMLIFQKKLF